MIRRAAIGSRLGPPAARREARLRRGVRASDAQRALRGDARRVPAASGGVRTRVPAASRERGAAQRAPRLLPERATCATSRCAGGSTRRGSPCSRTPRRSCRRCRPASELRAELELRRERARLRRSARAAEGARRGASTRSRRPGRDARGRGRRARARRPRAARRRARARRARPLPRQRSAGARAPPLPCGRRLAAPVGLGELPAHGRRVARGRLPRHRDGRRRRARGRARRRERAARPAGRSRGARGGDRALLRGRRAPRAAGRSRGSHRSRATRRRRSSRRSRASSQRAAA